MGLGCLGMSALPRTDANPHSDSFTGRDRKDSWLRRSAFPISSTLTCGPRIQRCYRTILKPAVKMVQATSARFGPLLVKTLRPPGTRNSRLESSARPRLVYIRGHTVTGISSLPLRPWNPDFWNPDRRLNLSRKPPWVNRARRVHNPVWLAAVSGNGSGLRDGPVPCAGLVRDREYRCAEPNRSRSIERAQSPGRHVALPAVASLFGIGAGKGISCLRLQPTLFASMFLAAIGCPVAFVRFFVCRHSRCFLNHLFDGAHVAEALTDHEAVMIAHPMTF